MKKSAVVICSLLLFIITSVAFTNFDQPGYKNLKILPKNITEKQMDSVMHHFSQSLGVKCIFCHVRNDATRKWDMASDAKAEKLIARKMWLMTKDINKKYFPSEDKNDQVQAITCYTCHKGQEMPASVPPAHHEEKEQQQVNDSLKTKKAIK